MVSQEGNSNTPCFLLPPFQGEIKPPAMRVVVDFKILLLICRDLNLLKIFYFKNLYKIILISFMTNFH